MIKMQQKSHIRILLVLILICFYTFGFNHLTKFVSFDEHYWLYNADDDRIHQYWDAISTGNWADTRINDKPGITLAYTSGLALLFESNPKDQIVSRDGTVKIFNPAKTEEINFLYRLPILLLTGLFIFYFFWIVRKITENDWIALFTVAAIYLSPVIIGMAQIVNPDSLFWVFGFASFLTYIAMLKLPDRKYFWLAMLFFGLSMASKYVSIIFVPFYLFILLAHYLFEHADGKNEDGSFGKKIVRDCEAYLGTIGGGFLIFAIMMPAVIVNPKLFYTGTIGFTGMAPIFWLCISICAALMIDARFNSSRIFSAILSKLQVLKIWLPKLASAILFLTCVFILLNWMSRHRLIDLSDIPFDLKQKPEFAKLPVMYRFIMEAVPLVFASLPFVLFSMLYFWLKNVLGKVRYDYLGFVLSSFILVFFLAVIKEGLLLTIRYSIILYPVSAFLSALAFYEFFWKHDQDTKKLTWSVAGFFSLILLIYGASSLEQLRMISEKNLRIFYNFHKIILFFLVIIVVALIAKLIWKFLTWKKFRQLHPVGITLGIIFLSLVSIWSISPYYFSYTNSFLPNKYIITGGWGYGGYEAAQYMNAKPDAANLTVWTDSYGFCEFFKGKCIHKAKIRTDKYPIDYLYSTLQNQLRPQFVGPAYMESGEPIWNLEIDGRYKNYVRIFKAEKSNLTEQ